jgi:hypothetical protein
MEFTGNKVFKKRIANSEISRLSINYPAIFEKRPQTDSKKFKSFLK